MSILIPQLVFVLKQLVAPLADVHLDSGEAANPDEFIP
jgi:hypothetical protein